MTMMMTKTMRNPDAMDVPVHVAVLAPVHVMKVAVQGVLLTAVLHSTMVNLYICIEQQF
jgi:hypothetical protein